MSNIRTATEDTMKELAKFLKQMGKEGSPEAQTQAKALTKALTQARANLTETKLAFKVLENEYQDLFQKEAERNAEVQEKADAQYSIKIDNKGSVEGFSLGDGTSVELVDSTSIPPIVNGEITLRSVVVESEFEDYPVIFVSPVQIENGAQLIGARPSEQGNFTLGLYRKKGKQ